MEHGYGQSNGKNGVNGPIAQQHVAKDLKSGLELALEIRVLVQGSSKRPKIAGEFWRSVQQVNGKNGAHGPSAQQHVAKGVKSGQELALDLIGHAKERLQRPKVAVSLNMEVYSVIGKNGVNGHG